MVVAFREDIESDLSVFHHVTPGTALDLPAELFINLVLRLPAYRGVLREHVTAILHEEQESASPSTSRMPALSRGRDGQQQRTVDSSAATLATDPGLAGMIEVRRDGDGR